MRITSKHHILFINGILLVLVATGFWLCLRHPSWSIVENVFAGGAGGSNPVIASVIWETYDDPDPTHTPDNRALDDNPGGGKRIFAEKLSHNDPWPANRKKATCKVTVSPAQEYVSVFFKWFDVDDPYTNWGDAVEKQSSIDPNDDAQYNHGNDNAPGGFTTGGWVLGSVLTDANGVAKYVFDLQNSYGPSYPCHPGDNLKVVASLDSDTLFYLTPAQIDQGWTPPNARMKISPMLTVWRTLWVEFDTMASPSSSQKFGIVTGTSASLTNNSLSASGTPGWATNCLEGGVLDPDTQNPGTSVNFVGGTTWEVSSNSGGSATVLTDYRTDRFDNNSSGGSDDVSEVFNLTGAAPPQSFGINTDDVSLSPPSAGSVISAMNSYYDDAYIQCAQLASGNTHSTFSFARNTASVFPTMDVAGDVDFWNVCAGFAYEHSETKTPWDYCIDNQHAHSFYTGDDDPENEGVPSGFMACVYGYAPSGKKNV